MHTNEPRKDPLTDLGYEPQDLNMKGIGKASAWFFGFTVFCLVISFFIFRAMNPRAFAEVDSYPAQPVSERIPPSPNPLLQSNVTAKTDMSDLRRMEDEALSTPAIIDPNQGIVRLPIDQAMTLYVERFGDPSRPTSRDAAPSVGTPVEPGTGESIGGAVTPGEGGPTGMEGTQRP